MTALGLPRSLTLPRIGGAGTSPSACLLLLTTTPNTERRSPVPDGIRTAIETMQSIAPSDDVRALARRACARASLAGDWPREDLAEVLAALGLDDR